MQPSTPEDYKRIVEAALLVGSEPLGVSQLRRLFDPEPGADLIRKLLDELRQDWDGRGVELVQLASG
jgi:segregation and condensation protein B